MGEPQEFDGTNGNRYQPIGSGSKGTPPGSEGANCISPPKYANRILIADVILTLTRDQPVDLGTALMYARHSKLLSRSERDDFDALGQAIAEQCTRQGVVV